MTLAKDRCRRPFSRGYYPQNPDTSTRENVKALLALTGTSPKAILK
jgi:hypothetical protein